MSAYEPAKWREFWARRDELEIASNAARAKYLRSVARSLEAQARILQCKSALLIAENWKDKADAEWQQAIGTRQWPRAKTAASAAAKRVEYERAALVLAEAELPKREAAAEALRLRADQAWDATVKHLAAMPTRAEVRTDADAEVSP